MMPSSGLDGFLNQNRLLFWGRRAVEPVLIWSFS